MAARTKKATTNPPIVESPIIRDAEATYELDRPAMLEEHWGEWVAYHGCRRLGMAATRFQLISKWVVGVGRPTLPGEERFDFDDLFFACVGKEPATTILASVVRQDRWPPHNVRVIPARRGCRGCGGRSLRMPSMPSRSSPGRSSRRSLSQYTCQECRFHSVTGTAGRHVLVGCGPLWPYTNGPT